MTGSMLRLALALALLVHVTSGVVIRDYNAINYEELDDISTLLDRYFQSHRNSQHFSSKNLMIGVYHEHCKQALDSPAFKGSQRHTGGDILVTLTIPAAVYPVPLNNDCAEVFYYKYNTSIQEPSARLNKLDHVSLTSWGSSLMRSSVILTNNFPFPINLMWHDESKDPIEQGTLQSGESISMTTFLGHIFAAYNANADKRLVNGKRSDYEIGPLVDWMIVNGEDYSFEAINRIETCDISEDASFVPEGLTCDDLDKRFIEFTHYVWFQKRKGLNYVQPQMVRAVTHNGFENRKLPADTYKWLKEWYYTNQPKYEEEEGPVGPCMNQHVAPSLITHLPPKHKDRLTKELQHILEGWYGNGTLEVTSIYGIRKYTNGSVLRMHVDTVGTHVVSAIINVDQEVEKEWPLLILDHDDNEHSVLMEAGDMLLYESAKLLHGRPEPFVGSHYDNIFIHYRPTCRECWDYDWV